MSRRCPALASLALAALAACGGAPGTGDRGLVPPHDAEYAQGLAAFRAGRYDDAVRAFRAVLAGGEPGADPERDAARRYLVVSLARGGDCDGARAARAEVPPGPHRSLELDEDSAIAACAARASVTPEELAAALAAGDDERAVLLAVRLGERVPAASRAGVEEAIDALSAEAAVRLAADVPPAAWPGPRLVLRRVVLLLHVGDVAGARSLAAGGLADPAGLAEAQRRIALAEDAAKVDPAAIGVLLPLSGRHAGVGKELRAAIELAAEGDKDVHLVFADSAGDEARAPAAFDELVAQAHPLFVLGPVGERESAAVAARAAAAGIPTALLTPSEGLVDAGAGVVRLVSSAEGRARGAARAAVALGYTALAVLCPADDLGRAQARAFQDVATRAGVQVRIVEYDPTATSLEGDVKRLLGLDPEVNARLRRHLRKHGQKDGWKTFSPDVDFDLLFIPDSYDRAAMLAAYLVYYNVELRTGDRAPDSAHLARKHGGRPPPLVQLMGSSGWHHPSLVVRGGPAVEGALIVDDFAGDLDAAPPAAADFAARWRARTGHPPSPIAAQAFDAARMALAARRTALGAPGGATRAEVRRALLGAHEDAGACGPAHVEADGELAREPLVLRVDGGELTFDSGSP